MMELLGRIICVNTCRGFIVNLFICERSYQNAATSLSQAIFLKFASKLPLVEASLKKVDQRAFNQEMGRKNFVLNRR